MENDELPEAIKKRMGAQLDLLRQIKPIVIEALEWEGRVTTAKYPLTASPTEQLSALYSDYFHNVDLMRAYARGEDILLYKLGSKGK